MPDRRSARLLAPLALVVFAVVLVIVISSAAGGGGSESSTTNGNRTTTTNTTTSARPRAKPRGYVVKASDTSLDSIARKTGVPTDRLLELNPAVDPQTLVPGQRIKLRP
jgi:LysM repeat protein